MAAIASMDTALNAVNSQCATIGAGINQMPYGADNLSSIAADTTASRSPKRSCHYSNSQKVAKK
jgi:flagellin-like hook-associated protein FlgL